MDGRRIFIFCFLMFFLFTTPDPHSSSQLPEREQQQRLAAEQHSLAVLNTTRYGDFNVTANKQIPLAGLSYRDGFAWDVLPLVQDRAREQLRSILDASEISPESRTGQPGTNSTNLSLPVYRNVTGKLHGDWVRWKNGDPHHLPRPRLNFTSIAAGLEYSTLLFGRNVTANHGTIFIALHEEEGRTIDVDGSLSREIKADLVVQSDDHSFGESWVIPLFGVHSPETGAITLSTTSEKFAGLSALPHLALSRDSFELSRNLLFESLSDAMQRRRAGPATFFPWSSLPHDSGRMVLGSPRCEYIMYLQQHPVQVQHKTAEAGVLQKIEDELRFPRGTPIPDPPPMVMSAVMFSPDCGFVLETDASPNDLSFPDRFLSGPKQEEYRKYAGRFVTIVAGLLAGQITLLKRQMKETSTPSTRSRVSFYAIATMSIGDALFIAFVLLELYSQASFLLLTATSFLGFFSVSFLSMKFQIEIWVAQPPERSEITARDRPPTPSLPLPATAPRPVDGDASQPIQPNTTQGDTPVEEAPSGTPQDANAPRTDASAMYSRFYLVLFCLMFFSSWALFWPRHIRAMYVNGLSFVYLSLWTPQIFRNAMRNCRKALRWDFVLGQSFLRLFPFLYFYCVPRNVLFIEAHSTVTVILVAWVWFQVCILVSQDALGPRFFVPEGWVPAAYDYHPFLYDAPGSSGEGPEPVGGLPLTSLRAEQREPTAKARDENKRTDEAWKRLFDCAICMQDIEAPVVLMPASDGRSRPRGTEGATTLLSRRAYMVTPCHHIFHSSCLETWMRLRLQCPICREAIPPV